MPNSEYQVLTSVNEYSSPCQLMASHHLALFDLTHSARYFTDFYIAILCRTYYILFQQVGQNEGQEFKSFLQTHLESRQINFMSPPTRLNPPSLKVQQSVIKQDKGDAFYRLKQIYFCLKLHQTVTDKKKLANLQHTYLYFYAAPCDTISLFFLYPNGYFQF